MVSCIFSPAFSPHFSMPSRAAHTQLTATANRTAGAETVECCFFPSAPPRVCAIDRPPFPCWPIASALTGAVVLQIAHRRLHPEQAGSVYCATWPHAVVGCLMRLLKMNLTSLASLLRSEGNGKKELAKGRLDRKYDPEAVIYFARRPEPCIAFYRIVLKNVVFLAGFYLGTRW